MSKYWKLAVAVIVFAALFSLILIKEGGVKKQTNEKEFSQLEEQLDSLYASKKPFVIMFYLEPSSFCCEGTKSMFEGIRHSLEVLSDRLDGLCPNLLIHINTLNNADTLVLREFTKRNEIKYYEGGIIFNAEGDLLRVFRTEFRVSDIVEYVKALQE